MLEYIHYESRNLKLANTKSSKLTYPLPTQAKGEKARYVK